MGSPARDLLGLLAIRPVRGPGLSPPSLVPLTCLAHASALSLSLSLSLLSGASGASVLVAHQIWCAHTDPMRSDVCVGVHV
jgi:hypothetical protein